MEANQQNLGTIHSLNIGVSVDCVVVGFDDKELNVLLIRRVKANDTNTESPYKLPGSPIYMDEGLDDAARRVLYELTGLKNVELGQFKAYGDVDRMNSSEEDLEWFQDMHQLKSKPGRIVSVAYLAFVRLKAYKQLSEQFQAEWVPVSKLNDLHFTFDHREMIADGLEKIRRDIDIQPSIVFEILPRKFTMLQFRALYEAILGYKVDVRNFHKKMKTYPYIVKLEEKQQFVAHRAAHYYKFDKQIYKQFKSTIS